MAEPVTAAAAFGDLLAAEAFTGVAAGASIGTAAAGTAAAWGAAPSILSSPLTQAIAGNAAGAVVSSVLGSQNVPTARGAPAITPVPGMPLPDDQAVANARRKSLAAQTARQGRASTILSDTASQTLGN